MIRIDFDRIPLTLVEQHVNAIRAGVRESARPDVATPADALGKKPRDRKSVV